MGVRWPLSVGSAVQGQVVANGAPGFLRDHVAELSECEQVCPRREVAVTVRVVEGHPPAPHGGLTRKGEATGQADSDVLSGSRLIATPQVGAASARRSSTGDVAVEGRRGQGGSVGEVPDEIVNR